MPPLATQLKSVSCFVEELIKTNTSADFVSCSKISPRTTNTSSPNAAINHFDLFLNNNLFRNDNYNDNIKKSSKTPSKFQYDPLYSEVKEGKRKNITHQSMNESPH